MIITPEIIASFRAKYPKFTDVVKWPDAVLQSALCDADMETGGNGWGSYVEECQNFKQRGMFLWAAHWLSLAYPSGATDSSASNSGAAAAVDAKTVGDESATYNHGKLNESAPEGGAAWYSSTMYGQQFLMLRRRAGMGARAV